jgi:hypothetical protein
MIEVSCDQCFSPDPHCFDFPLFGTMSREIGRNKNINVFDPDTHSKIYQPTSNQFFKIILKKKI